MEGQSTVMGTDEFIAYLQSQGAEESPQGAQEEPASGTDAPAPFAPLLELLNRTHTETHGDPAEKPLLVLTRALAMVVDHVERQAGLFQSKYEHLEKLRSAEEEGLRVRSWALRRALRQVDGKNEDMRKLQVQALEYNYAPLRVANHYLRQVRDALAQIEEASEQTRGMVAILKLTTELSIEMARITHDLHPKLRAPAEEQKSA